MKTLLMYCIVCYACAMHAYHTNIIYIYDIFCICTLHARIYHTILYNTHMCNLEVFSEQSVLQKDSIYYFNVMVVKKGWLGTYCSSDGKWCYKCIAYRCTAAYTHMYTHTHNTIRACSVQKYQMGISSL